MDSPELRQQAGQLRFQTETICDAIVATHIATQSAIREWCPLLVTQNRCVGASKYYQDIIICLHAIRTQDPPLDEFTEMSPETLRRTGVFVVS